MFSNCSAPSTQYSDNTRDHYLVVAYMIEITSLLSNSYNITKLTHSATICVSGTQCAKPAFKLTTFF